MLANLTCICRGNGKVYALFEICDAPLGSTFHASCKLPYGKPTIFQEVELRPDGSKREFVVAFPLSPHPINITLFCAEPDNDVGPQAIFRKTLAPGYIKWMSRLNYRLNRKKAYMIRDCEKDHAISHDEIELIGLVPLANKTVYRCLVNMPNGKEVDYQVKVLDDQFEETGIRPIVMGISEIPRGMKSPVDKLSIILSVYIPGRGIDCNLALYRNEKLTAFETISKYRFASLASGYEEAIQNATTNPNYKRWREINLAHETELLTQSKIEFDSSPLISIVVPLYKTPLSFFIEMAKSVTAQTYSNWELILVNSTPQEETLTRAVRELAAQDKRITTIELEKNLGIAGNTMAGIEAAAGEFIAFLDHDDVIAPNALYEYVFALNLDDKLDIFYSDSDHLDLKGRHVCPYFKPDYSKFLMREVNYMCHFRMVRASILKRIDFGDPIFDGAQDHDMLLKCLEVTENVFHCPKILYSWRMTPTSTAATLDNKPYANTAARLAIEEHLKREGIKADVVDSTDACRFHTKYKVEGDPKVSILIPTKDNKEILNTCVESVLERSSYSNFEIIVIENNSEEAETFENYERLKSMDDRIRVLTWQGDFNFSKINNYGAEHAAGEFLLFLNNDTKVINEDWIESLLGICQQNDVGAVGAKLFYPDGTIQHGGVYVQGDAAGHININLSQDASGYYNTTYTTREVSAVTAACLMCSKSTFDYVNGFDPDFAVAFNDVDLCMKMRKEGYKVVFNPNCMLYHYESISRGFENTPEKILRFNREASLLRYRWSDQYVTGDPYMNSNLDDNNGYFNLPKNPDC